MIATGSLIRWVTTHKSYEADGDVLVGLEPIYQYGIVMKVSESEPNYLAVASCEDGRWHIVNIHEDDYEIVSGVSER